MSNPRIGRWVGVTAGGSVLAIGMASYPLSLHPVLAMHAGLGLLAAIAAWREPDYLFAIFGCSIPSSVFYVVTQVWPGRIAGLIPLAYAVAGWMLRSESDPALRDHNEP